MEAPTLANEAENPAEAIAVLESQLRECYGRVVYSHKAHEKNADIYLFRLRSVKVLQIGLSAVTAGGVFAVLFSEESTAAAIIAAVTATIQFFLNTFVKEHSLSELAKRHADTASKLWSIREHYLSVLTDIVAGDSTVTQIREQRDSLQEELATIYEGAPRTIPRAYSKAQEALKLREDLTFSDDEIDLFLPRSLRKTENL